MTAWSAPSTPASSVREVTVNVADFAVARNSGVITTSGLGSCVAIVLVDAANHVAGLAHILLPDVALSRGPASAAKFPETAVPLLVREMAALGGTGRLVAKLAGGSHMFGALLSSGVNMGERNLEAARVALARARIPIVAEDTGGEHGRNVVVEVSTGTVRVQSLQRGERVL